LQKRRHVADAPRVRVPTCLPAPRAPALRSAAAQTLPRAVAQTADGVDADLWKDGLFKSKVTRYLCFTRSFSKENSHLGNVLVDMKLIDIKDTLPVGFIPIQETVDTRESPFSAARWPSPWGDVEDGPAEGGKGQETGVRSGGAGGAGGLTPVFILPSEEVAFRKKRLCIKFIPRDSTEAAICDIRIMGRTKQAPPQYTFIG
ncbi:Multivesicular body subunit 12B, partial [Galemys pyrenaicus]